MKRIALAVVVSLIGACAASTDALASVPSVVQVPEAWGAAMVGEDLRARSGRWSSTTTLEWTYEWQRCDSSGTECTAFEAPGADTDRLPLTADDLGHRLRVKVTATNASGSSEETSTVTDVVVDTDEPDPDDPPGVVTYPVRGLTLVPGVTLEADDLAARWHPWLGETIDSRWFGSTERYAWQRCDPAGESCEAIEGATAHRYTLTEADEGKTLRVRVTSTNRGGEASTTSVETVVVHELDAPDLEGALAAPQPSVGEDLWEGLQVAADGGVWGPFSGELSDERTGDGRAYQWLRCDVEGAECRAIEGATGSLYRTVLADDGSRLRYQVTATNAAGRATERSAASPVVLAPERPRVDVAPFDVEHAYTRVPLRADYDVNVSSGLGTGGPESIFEWRRCNAEGAECRAIEGATEIAYAPTDDDVGSTLRVEVTVENRIDSDSDISDASPIVEPAPTPDVEEPPVVTPDPQGTPTLSGDPVVGIALMAEDDGIWSPDMAGAFEREWQWQRCLANGTGCTDIPGGWNREHRFYTPSRRDVGYRLRVRIALFSGHGQAWTTSPLTDVVRDGEPHSLRRPSIDGAARVRDLLAADAGSWDPAEPDVAYQWLRCDAIGGTCRAISGASESTYEPTETDLGSALRVRVTASLNESPSVVVSAPTEPVGAASEPENVALPYIVGTAEVGELLEGWEGTWRGAQPIEYEPRWLRCDARGEECEPISTEWWHEVEPDDVGFTIRFEATATNDIGSVRAVSEASDVVPPLPPPANDEPPTVRGTAAVGETLHVDAGRWSYFPDDFDYQWQACDEEGAGCRAVEGAVADSFHVRDTDEEGTLRVVVTASNASGEAESTSDPTDVVGPMNPPAVVEAPGVFAVPREGWEVRAERGSWSGGTPMTFTYQWRQCDERGANCEDIGGAEQRVYTPVAEDVGKKLAVRVRATNDAGYSEDTSTPLFRVQAGEPRWADRVAISGEPVEGGEVEADVSGLRGTAPIELSYQWIRCDEDCEAIEGATGARYEPVTADVGSRLRLVATATSRYGEARSRSLLSAAVGPETVEGEPRSASRPQLEGLPRVTETVTSTSGDWRGTAPIETTLQWQRCEETAVSCVDIEGATEAEYEVEAADEGRRLRTVATAENRSGRATSYSLLSPPMKPAVDTAFVLERPVALDDVADAIEAARATVLTIDYDGERTGSYGTGDYGKPIEAVLDFFNDPWNVDGLELPVTKFTLTGDVATEALGELAAQVASRQEVPSIKVEARPPALRLLSEEEEEAPLIDEYVSRARVWAYGAPCDFPCEEGDWERVSPVSDLPVFPRVIELSFTWRPTTNLAQRIVEEERGFGWEFDLKLHNGENANIPFGIACLPWDTNDFWVTDRGAVLLDTSIPSDAGVYWDTAASDSCDEKDLTFGIYHPELLQAGTTYAMNIYLASAGDEERSTVSWELQMLERRLTLGGFPCDFSPWCVNVRPDDDIHEITTLLEPELGFSFPACYEYNDRMLGRARECEFPN
ncbi:MAG TPA: hypothetical protein VGO48_01255 [Conexibacter sp.]|jgi:hypothetical protein|nr:hypothetical protein [Conexibacter sp.]